MKQVRNAIGVTAKEQEVLDLFRSGPDNIRGNRIACYKHVYGVGTEVATIRCAKLFFKPEVKKFLEYKATALLGNHDINHERILLEMARIAFFDPRNYFDADNNPIPICQLSSDAAAAIQSFEASPAKDGATILKVRFASKIEALVKLGQQMGMFKDKVDLNVNRNEAEVELSEREFARRIGFILTKGAHGNDGNTSIN